MLNMNKIEEEILDLEKKDTTYAVCERLAWLYIVRDHNKPTALADTATVAASAPIAVDGDSEFMKAINGKDFCDVWCVIDELVKSVETTQPRLYETFMRKICSLDQTHQPQNQVDVFHA